MTKTTIPFVVALGIVLVLAVIGTLNKSNTAEVNTIEVEEVIEVITPEQEVDLIDKANQELQRINEELDAEEMLLVESKASNTNKYEEEKARLQQMQEANKLQFELEQEKLNSRIDLIQETRTSFQ